jgi:hypothetical protein
VGRGDSTGNESWAKNIQHLNDFDSKTDEMITADLSPGQPKNVIKIRVLFSIRKLDNKIMNTSSFAMFFWCERRKENEKLSDIVLTNARVRLNARISSVW